MPFAMNDGVRIYYETEGSGPPLVLHIGFTWSLQDWRDDGYVDGATRGRSIQVGGASQAPTQASVQSLFPPPHASLVTAGCEAEGNAQGCATPGGITTGKGKTGRVNVSEPSMRRRDTLPPKIG